MKSLYQALSPRVWITWDGAGIELTRRHGSTRHIQDNPLTWMLMMRCFCLMLRQVGLARPQAIGRPRGVRRKAVALSVKRWTELHSTLRAAEVCSSLVAPKALVWVDMPQQP